MLFFLTDEVREPQLQGKDVGGVRWGWRKLWFGV